MNEYALENRSATELAQAIVLLVQESKKIPFDLIWENSKSHIDGDPSFFGLMVSFLRKHHFEIGLPRNTFDENLLIALCKDHGLSGNRAIFDYDHQPQSIQSTLNGVLSSVFVRIQEQLKREEFKEQLAERSSKINQARSYFRELVGFGNAHVGMLEFSGTSDDRRRTKVNWSRVFADSFANMPYTVRGCWALYSGSESNYRFTVIIIFDLVEAPYWFGSLVAQHFRDILGNNGYGFCPVNNVQASAGFDKWGTLALNQANLIAKIERTIRCHIPGAEPAKVVIPPASRRQSTKAMLSAQAVVAAP